ncbi:MAG: HAD family hydrolase [Myxococcota bacterium]|nr:HAD family hydrolase [Myxococcota bacterium]
MQPLRGVLLDVDGTLLDSNDAHARAWLDAFDEFGLRGVPFDAVRTRIGKGGDKLLIETVGIDEDSDEGRRIVQRRRAIFNDKYLPRVGPFPMARELLEQMRDHGLKRIVATSASKQELRGLLDAANVGDLIDAESTSSDANASKPDPDIVRAAIARAGLHADELLMLGDTPYDVAAARGAGVATIALRCGGWRDDELRGAIAIYQHPADLLAHYEESPLGRNTTGAAQEGSV